MHRVSVFFSEKSPCTCVSCLSCHACHSLFLAATWWGVAETAAQQQCIFAVLAMHRRYVQYSIEQVGWEKISAYGTARQGTALCGPVRRGVVRYGAVFFFFMWYRTVRWGPGTVLQRTGRAGNEIPYEKLSLSHSWWVDRSGNMPLVVVCSNIYFLLYVLYTGVYYSAKLLNGMAPPPILIKLITAKPSQQVGVLLILTCGMPFTRKQTREWGFVYFIQVIQFGL